MAIKEKRSPFRTQWASQFAVASELCKEGYFVALTLGNHPKVDLMVTSPEGANFSIDVKGLYKKNLWGVSEKTEHKSLFYVFAFVPDRQPNRFFVMTEKEVNAAVREHVDHLKAYRITKGRSLDKVDKFTGLPWDVVLQYENAWNKLPK